MSRIDPRENDQYTLTFSSNKMLLAICSMLLLMVLCTMLGIRIERYQQQQAILLAARAGLVPVTLAAAPAPLTAPQPRPVSAAPAPTTTIVSAPVRIVRPEDLSDEVPAPTPILLVKASEPRPAQKPRTTIASTKALPTPKKSPAGTNAKKYVVQVVSSRDQTQAQQRARILAQQGVPAFVETANLGSKGMWYRVLAGTYPSQTAAKATLRQIRMDPQFEASFVRAY